MKEEMAIDVEKARQVFFCEGIDGDGEKGEKRKTRRKRKPSVNCWEVKKSVAE